MQQKKEKNGENRGLKNEKNTDSRGSKNAAGEYGAHDRGKRTI